MILTEPLDERQIQELHTNYHEAEETIRELRNKLRRCKRILRAVDVALRDERKNGDQ